MKKIDILKKLSPVGQCYLKDLVFTMSEATRNYASQLKSLERDGYIVTREVDRVKQNRGVTANKTVVLTSQGRQYLARTLKDDYYLNIAQRVNDRFSRNDVKKINFQLENSRVLLSFDFVGVRTFPSDKPSLSSLLGVSPENDSLAQKEEWMYAHDLSVSEVLDSGVYYSLQEIRTLVGSSQTDEDVDTLYHFRPRGVFINHEQLCLVYMPDSSSGKTINLNLAVETRGINTIKKYLSPIDIKEDINAIVLTNSSALVVDIAMAGRNGHHPRPVPINTTARQLLDCNTTLFDRVYVFPHTRNGIESLRYFVGHTFKQWQEDSYNLFNLSDNFSAIPINKAAIPVALGRDASLDLKTRAIFIPFVEIKFLSELHKAFEEYSVMTYSDMADSLSHIIRRNNKFYDIDGTELDIKHYKEDGYPVGVTSKQKVRKPNKKSFDSLAVMLTTEEKKQVKRVAKMQHTSASAYVREQLLKHLSIDYGLYEEAAAKEKEIRKQMRIHYKGGLNRIKNPETYNSNYDDVIDIDDLEDANE